MSSLTGCFPQAVAAGCTWARSDSSYLRRAVLLLLCGMKRHDQSATACSRHGAITPQRLPKATSQLDCNKDALAGQQYTGKLNQWKEQLPPGATHCMFPGGSRQSDCFWAISEKQKITVCSAQPEEFLAMSSAGALSVSSQHLRRRPCSWPKHQTSLRIQLLSQNPRPDKRVAPLHGELSQTTSVCRCN